MKKKLHVSDHLSLPVDLVTQRTSILGRTRSGKSHTAGVLVEEVLVAGQQVVVLDPKGDWWGLRSSADGKRAGLPITIMGGGHGDIPLEPTAGALVADVVVGERISVVLDLSLFESKADEIRFVTAFLDRFYRKNSAPVLLVIDEADTFAPQRPEKNETLMLNRMETICRRGSGRGIGVVLVSQRSASIHKGCLSQTELMIAHQTTAPQDRAAIQAWVVGHGDELRRDEFMSRIPKLPIGTAILWSPSWLDIYEEVKVRAKDTYDSSATPRIGSSRRAPKVLAQVDLERLKKHMSETIKKVAAEDPKALNDEIARLLRYSRGLEARVREQLEKSVSAKVAPKRFTGILRQAAQKVIKKPFIMKRDLDRLEKLEAELLIIKSKERGVVDNIEGLLARLTDAVHVAFKAGESVLVPFVQTVGSNPTSKITVTTGIGRGCHDGPIVPLRIIPAGPSPVVGGERRILVALSNFASKHVTKSQLAVLCGIKANGTTMATYISRLKRRGYMLSGADGFYLTQEGSAFIGEPDEPMTAEKVQQMWLNRFHSGPRDILNMVIGSYPSPMELSALASQLGINEGGTTMATYLSRLRAAGLIYTINASGVKTVLASKNLFEVNA